MLESFSINLCVPTLGHDRYDKVAINKFPIIVLGRKSDLIHMLQSDDIKDWVASTIKDPDLFKEAEWCIQHLKRDNTAEKIRYNLRDFMDAPNPDHDDLLETSR